MNIPTYGAVWQQATQNIGQLLDSDIRADDAFRRILELGYFSQFTSYPSATFNAKVVTWLTSHLASCHNFVLADLPSSLEELDIAPAATIILQAGRQLSPDLLRYVTYSLLLQDTLPQQGRTLKDVIEIGSGYGGLARTLKCFHPGARFWLVDTHESLRCAEIYLRRAFPELKICWIKAANISNPVADCDFYLIPASDVERVVSARHFDLAINVWSFGEMPNHYVDTYLRLLQDDCQVDWLFTINSFLAPVTLTSVERVQLGDWLFGLDDHWAIEHFEIDPQVHRCPLIRNFPKGIGLVARRLADESEISSQRALAAQEARAVVAEDWAAIAVTAQSIAEQDRPERMFKNPSSPFDPRSVSTRRLGAITDYIGHFNIEAGADGPFFRLWSDFRMNASEHSGALLIAYLSMVGKIDLERHCTKEELLLLKRLPECPLHQEYGAFKRAFQRGKISHNDVWLFDQEACDRALEHKKAGNFEEAEVLWSKVAEAYPAHGDCWFQLALLAEIRGDSAYAAVFSAHSVNLGCSNYAPESARLRTEFLNSLRATEKNTKAAMLSRWLTPSRAEQPKAFSDLVNAPASYGRLYFAGNTQEALFGLAQCQRLAGREVIAHAIELAVPMQKSTL